MKRIANIRYIDVLIAAVAVAVPVFALLGMRGVPIYICMMSAYIVPYIIFRQSSFCTIPGQIAMGVAFVMMSVFLVLNYWQSTVQLGTPDVPFLLYDAQTFHLLAQDVKNDTLGQHSPITPYMGYPVFLSSWLSCGVTDIAYPMIFNIFLLLCAMLLLGRCCLFVIDDKVVARRVSGYAMLLLAVIPGVMGQGTLLSKEPFIIFALSACVCAMYAIRARWHIVRYAIMFAVGVVVIASMRTTYLYVLLLFVAAVWLHDFKRGEIIPFLSVVAVIMIGIYVGSLQSWWGDSGFVMRYVSVGNYNSFFCGDSQEPLQRLIGPYHTYSLWLRLLLLPVSVAVQFIIPFPFMTAESPLGHPISMNVYHRMSYLWYLAAIPMLYYYLFYWWRKGGRRLSLLAFAAIVAYCIPAYMTAGAVSRYAYCFVPFLAVAGGYVLSVVLYSRDELKRLGVFALVYVILIAAALFVGAHPRLLFPE